MVLDLLDSVRNKIEKSVEHPVIPVLGLRPADKYDNVILRFNCSIQQQLVIIPSFVTPTTDRTMAPMPYQKVPLSHMDSVNPPLSSVKN